MKKTKDSAKIRNGKVHKIILRRLNWGLNTIYSPYLATKKSIISFSLKHDLRKVKLEYIESEREFDTDTKKEKSFSVLKNLL